ncbi:MAG: hypothetical protein LBP98_05480, partial [Tannerella sp.]|nr:hypothetical protein [Tannerella sp.]
VSDPLRNSARFRAYPLSLKRYRIYTVCARHRFVHVGKPQTVGLILGTVGTVEPKLDSIELKLDSIESKLDSVESKLNSVELKLDSVESKLDRLN